MNNTYFVEEKYCSFDTSILLNSIGFNGECHGYYNENGNLVKTFDIPATYFNSRAPSLQVAHAWLRVNYDINIRSMYTEDGYFARLDNKILPLDNCSYDEALDLGIQAICQSIRAQMVNEYEEDNDVFEEENGDVTTEIEERDGKRVLKIKK